MNPSNEDYTVGGFLEAVQNNLDHRITWCAVSHATKDWRIQGRQFDQNISAAIQASEWLGRVIKQQ